MASHLANIFGTEQDRVNCSFYYKIGACRHGDRCSRKHIKPPFSQTILLPNVYHNPAHDPVCKLTEKELQEGFDAVYEDLYCELAKFGHLLELHVCDNVGDHLIVAMKGGTQGDHFMPNCHPSPIFAKRAADKTRMGNATVEGFATSCT
ncbi:putative zinc finger C-x8-C-x5-C-x3-H type (and similar) [Lyophyllum shimeji]|uniref:Zinc finger C-x8-C-x5-C-x3-H type (And similar) n=1 Tax=Lyophyllum shimeji TaxID=47721 RepID=A0A9P3PL65_LYOSH|nr:putative zinc finger C-x8-C-x5-C-x3-H type (and similar) [Lyophyllum shimeji]